MITILHFTPNPTNLSIETMEEITMSNTTSTTITVKNTTKINWKVRLKNKVWLAAMASLIISFVYGLLELLDIVPSIT